PNRKTARNLAQAALSAKLAACVNLIPGLESHYWWQGRLETGKEVLLVLKTTAAHVVALEKLFQAIHPYDTPEFLVLPVGGGSDRYLAWLSAACP
ncbi:MAG TPA: divalent-cation tolerance protein CutA, partial [Verrucomicrobiae bacterium]